MTDTKSNFRWVVVALLFFITIINYVDRASIAYAIDNIAAEFHFSQNKIGLILGAFGIGYAFTTILGGIVADHFGAKKTFIWAAVSWSLATALMGASNGFIIIFIARILLGLAEGPNFPAMTRAISDWLPEAERNRSLSYALISVPLALAIGGPIVSQLILFFSWRGAYFALTAIAFLWLPVWILLFRDKPKDSAHVNAQELAYIEHDASIKTQLEHGKNPWRVLLLNKTLLANNWSFFVFGFYLFFFMTWLPNYLSMTYHFNLKKIGIYTIFPWLLAAIMMWAMGIVCDRIFKKTKDLRLSRSYPILLSQLLSAACVIPIIFIKDIEFAIIFISLAVGFAMSANASFYAVNLDVAKARVGTALGIMDAIFALSGFCAPTITGLIVSYAGHFEAVFWLLAALGLSSTVVTFMFHNR
jgi:sugar phosphate permease